MGMVNKQELGVKIVNVETKEERSGGMNDEFCYCIACLLYGIEMRNLNLIFASVY